MVFNGAIQTLAAADVFRATITGIADGTALETTERYTECDQVTCTVRIEDTRGKVHAIEVTVYGWKVLLLIDALTKIPLAVKVGQIQEHEALWTRALVTQARMHLAGDARLAKVVIDQGFLDGSTLWWLDQQDIRFVVPAKWRAMTSTRAHARRSSPRLGSFFVARSTQPGTRWCRHWSAFGANAYLTSRRVKSRRLLPLLTSTSKGCFTWPHRPQRVSFSTMVSQQS